MDYVRHGHRFTKVCAIQAVQKYGKPCYGEEVKSTSTLSRMFLLHLRCPEWKLSISFSISEMLTAVLT